MSIFRNRSRWGSATAWRNLPGLCRFGVLTFFLLAEVAVAAPAISGFSPTSGRPGTHVTINGSGFASAVRVEFGTQRYAAFVRVSDSQIRAVVPDDGLTGPIRVEATGGSAGASAAAFQVAPRIDEFSPLSGSTTTTVTINGANFVTGGTVVVFGSVTSSIVNVTAVSQVQARVPAGISNVILRVITSSGTATSRVEFVSTTAPAIESFTPENGLAGKGVQVVINGANFTQASAVTFNNKAAAFTKTADTQLIATVPAGATTGKIRVTTPTGTATSAINFVVGPTITEFHPPSGTAGELIVISGNDFAGITNVTFGGTNTSQLIITAQNQVQARVPTGAKNGRIGVHTTTGEGFTTNNFVIGPLISDFSPEYGPVGTSVVINGGGFVSGGTTVKFGTRTANPPFVSPPTQVTAVVPAGSTNAPITVSTSTGTNVSTKPFLVTTALPLITEFEPQSAPPGTGIQIRGAKLQNATSVTIGGVPVAFQATADTLILATVPAGVQTGPVRVSNASGTGVSPQTFYAPPWITSFTPASGVAGSFVSIRGTNFTGLTRLFFGPEPATPTSVSPGEIITPVPTFARTGPLTLETPGGTFITTNIFTVPPKILSAQPQIGPVGTLVRINGTSFFGVTNVQFNGVSATFTNLSSQAIDAVVPAGAATGPIRVATPDGESISGFLFTVTVPSDLAISEVLSTNLISPGGTVTYITTVTNRGPSIQTQLLLTNRLAPALVLQSAVPSQGGCTIAGTVVSCGLGVLTNNRSATLTVVANVPTSGVFTNTASIRSAEGDTAPGNNLVQNVLVAASVEQRTLSIRLLSAPTRAVISWPASLVPFKLEFIPELGSTSVTWIRLASGPVLNNGTNSYTNTVGQAQEFYRLRFP